MDGAMPDGGIEIRPGGQLLAIGKTAFHIDHAARFQHPVELLENGVWIVEMLNDLHQHDAIHGSIREILELHYSMLVNADDLEALRLQEPGRFALAAAKINDLCGRTAQRLRQTRQADPIHRMLMPSRMATIFGHQDRSLNTGCENAIARRALLVNVALLHRHNGSRRLADRTGQFRAGRNRDDAGCLTWFQRVLARRLRHRGCGRRAAIEIGADRRNALNIIQPARVFFNPGNTGGWGSHHFLNSRAGLAARPGKEPVVSPTVVSG